MGNPNCKKDLPHIANEKNRRAGAARSRTAAAQRSTTTGASAVRLQNNATTTVATSHHTSNSSQAAPNGTGQTVPAGAASVPAAVNQNTTVHSTVTVHTTQTNSQAAHTAHFPVSNQVSTMNQIPAAPQVPTTIQVAAASHDPAAGTTTGPRRSHRHWTSQPLDRMTAGQRRALSNLAYSERFTLYEDRMNEEEVRQREILGECSPHVLAAISSKIRNIIRDDPRHTWYEPVVPISAVAVQAVLRWAEDQCTSGAPHVSHIDMTPLYADNIVSVVKLATVIGISYTLMGVREAAVQYCNHYGSGAANELLMVAQQRRCPTLEAVLRPFCT